MAYFSLYFSLSILPFIITLFFHEKKRVNEESQGLFEWVKGKHWEGLLA